VSVSQGLVRLLRIRELEEEQCRITLAEALSDLDRLRTLERAARTRGLRGRSLVSASAGGADSLDRRAGVEETRAADHGLAVLAPRIAEAQWRVNVRRGEYLDCRMRKRQVETLLREAEAREAADKERKNQQALDDWFRTRQLRRGHGEERAHAAGLVANAENISRPGGTSEEASEECATIPDSVALFHNLTVF
jgi:hypothetical protein